MRVIAHSRYETWPIIILQHPEGIHEFDNIIDDSPPHHGWETNIAYKTREEIIKAENARKMDREIEEMKREHKIELFIRQLPSMSVLAGMGITPRTYIDFVNFNEREYRISMKRLIINDILEGSGSTAIMWSHVKSQIAIDTVFFHPVSGRLIFCLLHRS